MRPDPVEKPTLTVEEVGAVMGVSRTVAYDMARDGRLPVIRANTRLLIPTQAFLRWWDSVEPAKPAQPKPEPVTVRRD
jgi:excisionase family DNA binding protein